MTVLLVGTRAAQDIKSPKGVPEGFARSISRNTKGENTTIDHITPHFIAKLSGMPFAKDQSRTRTEQKAIKEVTEMANKKAIDNSSENIIHVAPIAVKRMKIIIEGTTDLVLNKMNASNYRQLIADDRKTQALWEAQHKNKWEDIITAVHWRDPIPVKGDNSDGLATNRECSEEMLMDMLQNNAPCITAFGLKKSWGQAVVQQEVDKYSTKFNSAVNIVSPGGLIPVKVAEWRLDERLMTPKRGSPITTRLNHFIGWKAEIPVEFTTNVFDESAIVTIVNYAGFSIGIGSGRTSGYGRYEVVGVIK